MRKLLIILALSAALVPLFTGCVSYEARPISAGDNATQFAARRLDDPGLKSFVESHAPRMGSWPPAAWDLDSLTAAALYFHPGLALAREQWGVAEAGIKTAGGRPNPVVSATPGYDFSAASGVPAWIPLVNIDWPLETAGKRNRRLERARELSAAARFGALAAAWQVRAGLRAALVDVVGARRRQSLLAAQISLQAQIVASLEQRHAAGAAAEPEVAFARLALNKTRLDLGDAQRAETEAQGRLCSAIGVPLAATASLSLDFDLAKAPPGHDILTGAEARQHALLSRPDLLAALADYAASESALRLEIAKQYPDIHLGTGYQWDQGESKWQLGVTAEIPVLNRNQGPIEEAKARRGESAARFNALQARIITDVEQTLAVLELTRRQLTEAETLLAGQQKHLASIEAQRAAGAAERMDELQARLELSAVESGRLDRLARWQQAIGAAEDALQPSAINIEAVLANSRASTTPVKTKPDQGNIP
ncbi:MAG TPA: TolC family protein [Verrucomicrobiae bacterium]|nr:TolC family protein [Verrucomicrobiae bacterium]